VNPNYNKIRNVAAVEATFTIPGEYTVAKIENKARPDLIFEPRSSFSKINEDVYSICWFVDKQYELLYGTGSNVKVCDTREYQSHYKT
jgi:hypothetical protein